MIKNLYSKYFQKSRSFLYPLLGIAKKNNPSPVQTYMGYNDIKPIHKKLICLYLNDPSPEFEKFQNEKLIRSPLYQGHSIVGDHVIYIFDFQRYGDDWDLFMKGKYSQLSANLKDAIKYYYGAESTEYQFIDTYLFPEKYFEHYSKLLDININELKRVGELCDQYDEEKEVLIFSTKHLEISD